MNKTADNSVRRGFFVQAFDFDITKTVIRKARFKNVCAAGTQEDIPLERAIRKLTVGAHQRSIVIELFIEMQRNHLSGPAGYLQLHPAGHVRAHIHNINAGLGFGNGGGPDGLDHADRRLVL